MEPVLGLVEDDRDPRLQDVFGDFLAAVRGQAVHEQGAGLGERHERVEPSLPVAVELVLSDAVVKDLDGRAAFADLLARAGLPPALAHKVEVRVTGASQRCPPERRENDSRSTRAAA